MAQEEVGVAFDEFAVGGLLDDADITVKLARFEQWDYKGKVTTPVLALRIDMEDSEDQIHDEHLSSGDLKNFVPSNDGKRAIPVGAQTKLNANTNAVAFLISLMNADTRGELAAKLRAGDVSVLEGAKLHIVRKPQPKRAGIIQAPGTEGQPQREKTYLAVEKVIAYPWEAAGTATPTARTAAAPVAQSAAAIVTAAPAAGGDTDDLATSTLIGIVSEAGGSIKTTAIAGKAYGALKAEAAPVRNAVLGLIVKPEFLNAPGKPWAVANGVVSLG